MVVAKDGTIYRFSATKSLHLLSATNAIRRALVFACTHQYPLCQFSHPRKSNVKKTHTVEFNVCCKAHVTHHVNSLYCVSV